MGFTDSQSVITGMTGWIDNPATPAGPGAVFLAQDGGWNSTAETGQWDIPLTTVLGLANGAHTLSVKATDAAGNVSAVRSPCRSPSTRRPRRSPR